MTSPVAPRTDRQRHHAADTAKGIAILFVVFGHAWRGVYGAGLIGDHGLFNVVDQLIYAWHMPLFFFLSGLHFLDLAMRQQTGTFVKDRLLRLLWPMALWTWIFFGFRVVAGEAANTPVSLADFPLVPLPPYEHLWFLWALFLIQITVFGLIACTARRLGRSGLRWLCAILVVFLTALFAVTYFPVALFDLAIVHLPYFLAGVALAELSQKRPPIWGALAAAVGVGVLLYGVTLGLFAVPVSLGLVLLLWLLFAYFDREMAEPGPVIGLLRYVGQTSMVIYLAHTIFSAAFRIALLRVDVTSVPAHLVVAVVAGVIGPLVLLWVARRFDMRRLLGI